MLSKEHYHPFNVSFPSGGVQGPPEEPLRDAELLELVFHVHKALQVQPGIILDAMRRNKQADPEINWTYALYGFVFEFTGEQGAYCALRYEDSEIDGRINYVICARKGAFVANSQFRDPQFADAEFPKITAKSGKGLNVLLPHAFNPQRPNEKFSYQVGDKAKTATRPRITTYVE